MRDGKVMERKVRCKREVVNCMGLVYLGVYFHGGVVKLF